jgi:hypothetical protein
VTDLEVGAEGLNGRGREFLCDEDDGLGHWVPRSVGGAASLVTQWITRALVAARQ